MFKILTILGARPQFIKAAVVSEVFAKVSSQHPGLLKEIYIHTGQHYDDNMSGCFFRQLCLPKPSHNLVIGNCSDAQMIGQIVIKAEKIIQDIKPDLVLVYGDTNSTVAAALAANYLGVSVAHVEAGVRAFDLDMLEEKNRILTDRLSNLLFCPTQTAVKNLSDEGIKNTNQQHIMLSGDVMLDMYLKFKEKARPDAHIAKLIKAIGYNFVLMTLHRSSNVDSPTALEELVKNVQQSSPVPIVFPVHPRTRKKLKAKTSNKLHLIDPVDYFNMLFLLEKCLAVVTDSGGLQREAYFNSKPCIVLRENTEWVELVELGSSILVGRNREKIEKAFGSFSNKKIDFSKEIFGVGKSSEKIVNKILNYLESQKNPNKDIPKAFRNSVLERHRHPTLDPASSAG